YKLLGDFQPDRPPNVKKLDIYVQPVEEHEGTVVWSAPIELAENVKPESLAITVDYGGQVCSDQMCVPIGEKIEARFAGYMATAGTPGEYHPDPALAQVVLRGHLEPAAVAPGGKAKLVISAEPTPGWHLYAYARTDPDQVGANKPTLIHLLPLPGWTRSAVKASSPPKPDPSAGGSSPAERIYDQPVTWVIDLTAPSDSKAGETIVSGYVAFQTCKNAGGCLYPQAVQFRAS